MQEKQVANIEVDSKTGHINLKKGEAWINTFTPIVTYLLRCNSDVTSLLSGTAIKAVIAYVTDYVSKSPLKTYGIFESIKDIFDRNAEMLNSEKPRQEKARKLLTSIVNSMTTKMEIGAPMASAYLLEQPDHYTSHRFKPFYWMPFVRQAQSSWPIQTDSQMPESVLPIQKDQVILGVVKGKYAAFSVVSDYTLRPEFYDDITAHKEKGQVKLPPPDKDDKTQVDLEGEQYISEYDTPKIKDMELLFQIPLYVEDYSIDQDSEDTDDIIDGNEITLNDMKFLNGGTIPRRDKGDHKYYCATMLTLFKP
ncbi:hypothetical protein K439DRAFT_1650069 [Ramaria rubella]|nr:hypothetical protein K439DRAFT_1650069 [Ramaria rubella]